jgi:TRAP-type C4-dicarboxylate transport system substrate-binding protein
VIRSWAISWALVCYSALAVVIPTAKADTSSDQTLFINDTIAHDSAAARAAQRWVTTMPSEPKLKLQFMPASSENITSKTGVVLAPLGQWSRVVPALDVLRLPFFYADVSAVQRAIDGELGTQLAQATQQAGWKLLAIWDAGMTAFSGNQRYNRLQNLSGMQFALWEHDPLVETELRALDVWSRVVGERGVQRMTQECLVNSRSATPAQMQRENLAKVHLDLTLTHDRYEGVVLAIPSALWNSMTTAQRKNMTTRLPDITAWERAQAAQAQTQAVEALRKAGMQVHQLDATQWQTFASRMPPWQDFLVKLDTKTANDLIAAARIAATTGGSDGGSEKALANPQPAAHATE